MKAGLRDRFTLVRSRKPPADDVAAGREWVEAYVPFVHYVEGVYDAAQGKMDAHADAAAEAHAGPPPAHAHGANP